MGDRLGRSGEGPGSYQKRFWTVWREFGSTKTKSILGGLGAIDGDGLGPIIHQNQSKPQKTPESTNDQNKYLRAEPLSYFYKLRSITQCKQKVASPTSLQLGSALRYFCLVVRRFWGFLGFWLVLMDYGAQTVPIYSPQTPNIDVLLVDPNLPQTVQNLFR